MDVVLKLSNGTARRLQIGLTALSAAIIMLLLAACGSGNVARTLPNGSAPALGKLAASGTFPAPTAIVGSGSLADVGSFIRGNRPLLVQNRAAASVVHLAQGQIIQLPPGMRLDPFPGVAAGPPEYLMPSISVGGQKLYITVFTDGSGARLAQIDDQTFRAATGGDVLITAQDSGRVDHQVAVNAAGDLLLDPAPVPGNVVAIYGSGQALDVQGMAKVGRLAPVRWVQPPTEWYFNTCEQGRCSLSYRVGPLRAPFSGRLICQPGEAFDLLGNGFRLQFRPSRIAGESPNQMVTSTAGCGPNRAIQVGDVISSAFVNYAVTAVSDSGAPLSVAVAYNGTLYVGRLNASASCPPCRGL